MVVQLKNCHPKHMEKKDKTLVQSSSMIKETEIQDDNDGLN